jgi:hypothetical protein
MFYQDNNKILINKIFYNIVLIEITIKEEI